MLHTSKLSSLLLLCTRAGKQTHSDFHYSYSQILTSHIWTVGFTDTNSQTSWTLICYMYLSSGKWLLTNNNELRKQFWVGLSFILDNCFKFCVPLFSSKSKYQPLYPNPSKCSSIQVLFAHH